MLGVPASPPPPTAAAPALTLALILFIAGLVHMVVTVPVAVPSASSARLTAMPSPRTREQALDLLNARSVQQSCEVRAGCLLIGAAGVVVYRLMELQPGDHAFDQRGHLLRGQDVVPVGRRILKVAQGPGECGDDGSRAEPGLFAESSAAAALALGIGHWFILDWRASH